MKKVILVIGLMLLLTIPSFAGHPDEEPVILPNGTEAFDAFNTSSINSNRWQSLYLGDWNPTSNSLIALGNGYNKFLFQPYDYNSGALKSNYYRFEVKFLEKKNSIQTGGFKIKQDITSENESQTLTSSGYLYGEFYTYIGGSSYTNNVGTNSGRNVKTVETIMQRVGNSNTFDVTMKVYLNSSLLFTRSNQATYTAIYPTIFGYGNNNVVGKFTKFSAFRVPMQDDSVTITALKQDGDVINIAWSLDSDYYDSAEIVYSTDNIINFDSDTSIYTGSSARTTVGLNITNDMKNNGFIGIRGKKNSDYSNVEIQAFNYLNTPVDFAYALTDIEDSYKYTWSEVVDANGYSVINGSVSTPLKVDARSMTLYGVDDPTKVAIVATQNAIIGAGTSNSIPTNGVKGALGPVTNVSASLDLDSVQLTWDAYPAADAYIVFQKTSLGTFSVVEDNILPTTLTTTLNNDFLVNTYKVKAVVLGQWSEASEFVEVKNHVKDVQTVIDATTRTIGLTWTSIGDATSYKVYISNNSAMSSPTVETASSNNFDFTYALNDISNKYVQIEAIEGSVVSDKNAPVMIDMSANVTAENFVASYISNSYIVNLSWDVIPNVVDYKIYVGYSDGTTVYKATTSDVSYNYTITGNDPDILYFKVQGIGASQTYVISPAVHTKTYSLDAVKNLSSTKVGDTIQISWSPLFRSTSYVLEISDDTSMTNSVVVNQTGTSYTYTVLESDGLTKYFRVKALYGSTDSKYSSVSSSDASDAIIMTIDSKSLSNKIYGAPMAFPINLKVNESVIYNANMALKLENALHPNGTTLMKYIYPEIESIQAIDPNNMNFVPIDLSYITKITTGLEVGGTFRANAGYVATAIITDTSLNSYLGLGYDIVFNIKTDLVFEQSSTITDQSVLYVGPSSEPLTWMELPFVLEEQINQVERAISSAEGVVVTPISDKDSFSVKFNYDRTPTGDNNSVENIVNIIFKNKNTVPTY